MQIPIFQVDAFASTLFSGNPAAVCILQSWPEDALLMGIAAENNLSETAFAVPAVDHYELRWFTPVTEVQLCGHATLATAHVILNELNPELEELTFHTVSGALIVSRAAEARLSMDFPAIALDLSEPDRDLDAALGQRVDELYWAGDQYVAVLAEQSLVTRIEPDFSLLSKLEARAVSVTAPGEGCDFVSRFFAPKVGIPEDPVTGSAHCALTPYWASRLDRKELSARQLSARGGEIHCIDRGQRVVLSGSTVLYMHGTITV